jgi:hypothetical protein
VAEVNLTTAAKPKTAPLRINITSEGGGTRTLNYEVRKLTGKAAMEAQIAMAEFAKDKKRDEIVGSLLVAAILSHTTPLDGAPELINIMDELDGDQLVPLIQALTEAATGSTVND